MLRCAALGTADDGAMSVRWTGQHPLLHTEPEQCPRLAPRSRAPQEQNTPGVNTRKKNHRLCDPGPGPFSSDHDGRRPRSQPIHLLDQGTRVFSAPCLPLPPSMVTLYTEAGTEKKQVTGQGAVRGTEGIRRLWPALCPVGEGHPGFFTLFFLLLPELKHPIA